MINKILAPAVRASWATTAVAALLLAVGTVLSYRVEPGVRVDAVTLAGTTPAIRFLPTTGEAHPTALLAHGISASKETLFRYGEALAAAGFRCFAIDLPGHGESSQSFSFDASVQTIDTVSRALGSVDVFLGHSMGAYAGAESVRQGHLRPKLFIALGALPKFPVQHPPILLLAGRFDEHVPISTLRAQRGARLVASSWSDHFFELYDPVLVHAAVQAARSAVGEPMPGAPRQWYWRLLGLVLAVLGGIVLGVQLPELFPRLAPVRGVLIALAALGAIALAGGTWFNMAPGVRRLPWQLALASLLALVFLGLGKLRVPRWSLAAIAAACVPGCLIIRQPFLALIAGGILLTLLAGMGIAWMAAARGTRRDGDLALAIFAGYVFGQWPIWFLIIRHL